MKVKIVSWHAVAAWRWDMPEDEVCGICRVQFDGTCPKCKFPGDDCPISVYLPSSLCLDSINAVKTITNQPQNSHGSMQSLVSYALLGYLDQSRVQSGKVSYVSSGLSNQRQRPERSPNPADYRCSILTSSTTQQASCYRHRETCAGCLVMSYRLRLAELTSAFGSLCLSSRNGTMSPPPEYSHSSAQTTGDHDDNTSKRLSQFNPLHEIDENAQDVPYPEPSSDELIHPPDFRPFFTLIENPETGEHHHPDIHYVFSDDDPAFLTSAIIENISFQTNEAPTVQNTERVIVLDVGADGKSITDAQSLSPDWQVSATNLSQAPSWSDGNEGKRDGSLMLTVSGSESHIRPANPQRKRSVDGMLGRVEGVIGGYSDRISALNKLIKKDVLEQHQEQSSAQEAGNESQRETTEAQ